MVVALAGLSSVCLATDYYVATDGSDTHPGSKTEPWKTIQHAADTLQPGDTVYIRGGVYRECVQPQRGGTSEDKRIIFKAFPGETPVIKGSERITTWQEQGNNVWKAVIPDTFFGDYNPYTTKITGEWMGWGSPLTGGVALDDLSFRNINHENEVAKYPRSWSARHEGTATTIYANFAGVNPNTRLAEIYARELLFFPRVNGLKYITIDGLTFLHAANGWVEYHGFQKGAVGTRYGYGWIIQNCHIADCRTVGICSGEYRPKTQNLVPEKNEDIEAVGHHIFRNNLVERCGQAGFIGAYGYAASVVDATFDPRFTKSDLPDGVTLAFSVNDAPLAVKCPLITYDFIGKWSRVNQGIEDQEGKGITIAEDLLGKPRNKTPPAAGPFEPLAVGKPNTFTLTAGPRRPETSGQKTSHQQ